MSRTFISIAGVLVAIGVVAAFAWQKAAPRELTSAGRITAVDHATRTGEIEIIHPRTGQAFLIAAEVDPNAELIGIDGAPIVIAELEPGMQVTATGMLYPATRRVVATRIQVDEPLQPEAETVSNITETTDTPEDASGQVDPNDSP